MKQRRIARISARSALSVLCWSVGVSPLRRLPTVSSLATPEARRLRASRRDASAPLREALIRYPARNHHPSPLPPRQTNVSSVGVDDLAGQGQAEAGPAGIGGAELDEPVA